MLSPLPVRLCIDTAADVVTWGLMPLFVSSRKGVALRDITGCSIGRLICIGDVAQEQLATNESTT